MLSVLQSMLATATPERSSSRARLARHRAVTRVLEYIDANLTEPLSLQRLCVAGSVAARTLEYGFHELFGVSPLKYVRLERLTRVRRALLQTPAPAASVTDTAMRWGFWRTPIGDSRPWAARITNPDMIDHQNRCEFLIAPALEAGISSTQSGMHMNYQWKKVDHEEQN